MTHPTFKRSSQLDLLRTLAIFLVFTSHFNIFAGDDWFKPFGQVGWIGVDLFFILSGFLITSQLLKEECFSLKNFYLRRGLRIWPNYFFVLLIYILVPSFAERSVLPPLWKFFTFTQNFDLNFKEHGAFSHAWSLCVEEQFYIVLPLILMVMSKFGSFRKSIFIFAGVIIGGIGLRYFLWQHFLADLYATNSRAGVGVLYFREIYYPTYCRLDGLTIGVCIAALYRLRPRLWEKICRHSNRILLTSLVILGISVWTVQSEISFETATIGFPLVDFAFGGLVISALAPGGLFSKIRLPGVQSGATLAFAFYLTHKQMIHLSKDWLIGAGVSTTSILYPLGISAACVFTAAILYFCVEKPFLRWRDRILY